jgi:hypothetical protein
MVKFFLRLFGTKNRPQRPLCVVPTDDPHIFEINGVRVLTVSKATALMITKYP